MTPDKYKAVWLSHSSIADFLKCPRLYFLRNVYKDPRNNHKITIMTPPLALGQAIHDVFENISILPTEERFKIPLKKLLEKSWQKVSGKKGGFLDRNEEDDYVKRAEKMLDTVENNPGPLTKRAVKIKADGNLPYYWLSEEENIILCGKIDWLEYLEKTDSVGIIDFKTGKNTEDETSLQLPIYYLLATNTQKRKVTKASYWYLDHIDGLTKKELPDIKEAKERVEKIASRIKLARQLGRFVCAKNGCRYCIPFERVLKGEGEKVAISEYQQDIYLLSN